MFSAKCCLIVCKITVCDSACSATLVAGTSICVFTHAMIDSMGMSCHHLSVTSQCSMEMDKRRISQTVPHNSPGTLVFWCQNLGKIQMGSPPTEAPNAGGVV